MPGKSLITSRTFWVNALTLAISFGGYLTGIVPAEFSPYVAAGLAIANVVLRLITNQPIDRVV